MSNAMVLRGTELRYALTMYVQVHGPATIPTLLDVLDHWGFAIEGRPSKVVSDALRWEVRYGRVRRLGRGRYGPGPIPRSTAHRIDQRVLALRAEARRLSLGGGQESPWW